MATQKIISIDRLQPGYTEHTPEYKGIAESSRTNHNKLSEEDKAKQMELVKSLTKGKKVKAVAKSFDKTVIEGKLIDVDYSNNLLLIEEPDGKVKVIVLLEFIVTIIPLLDVIINWFKGLFRRRK